MAQKQKKGTAWDAYQGMLKAILDARVEDGRHKKDVIKIMLRLFSHFSDPELDKGLELEMVKAKKDEFEIHHPHEIAKLADDLMKGDPLPDVMKKSQQKVIKTKEAHTDDHS